MKRKYKPSNPYLNIKLTNKEKQDRNLSSKLKWTTIITRIDIDTGEIITENQAKQYYTKIKTDKHARISNEQKTRGEVRLYFLYRKNIQIRLW